ncbi:hypothetical protein SS50377_21482 [Spironucleus salmonicida]|uniref:Uncharacterized protein n=1 Tax=Spironucleus salmonicida TaxID=348837 RepID=V6LSM2_9EUKA|nr:hypothetical protein SS50377_21482 [Spironucleus salmonicida]|eukprot:EST46676.1 Hypothetical protein SS50377_13307 [Spironucleus salmonicida]
MHTALPESRYTGVIRPYCIPAATHAPYSLQTSISYPHQLNTAKLSDNSPKSTQPPLESHQSPNNPANRRVPPPSCDLHAPSAPSCSDYEELASRRFEAFSSQSLEDYFWIGCTPEAKMRPDLTAEISHFQTENSSSFSVSGGYQKQEQEGQELERFALIVSEKLAKSDLPETVEIGLASKPQVSPEERSFAEASEGEKEAFWENFSELYHLKSLYQQKGEEKQVDALIVSAKFVKKQGIQKLNEPQTHQVIQASFRSLESAEIPEALQKSFAKPAPARRPNGAENASDALIVSAKVVKKGAENADSLLVSRTAGTKIEQNYVEGKIVSAVKRRRSPGRSENFGVARAELDHSRKLSGRSNREIQLLGSQNSDSSERFCSLQSSIKIITSNKIGLVAVGKQKLDDGGFDSELNDQQVSAVSQPYQDSAAKYCGNGHAQKPKLSVLDLEVVGAPKEGNAPKTFSVSQKKAKKPERKSFASVISVSIQVCGKVEKGVEYSDFADIMSQVSEGDKGRCCLAVQSIIQSICGK